MKPLERRVKALERRTAKKLPHIIQAVTTEPDGTEVVLMTVTPDPPTGREHIRWPHGR